MNDNYIGKPYPHHARLNTRENPPDPFFHSVFHVVRCPISQISSLTSHLFGTYAFIYNTMVAMNYEGLPESTIDHLATYGFHGFSDSVYIHDIQCARVVSTGGTRNSLEGHRGHPCWLYFSAAAWVFWNKLIERCVCVCVLVADKPHAYYSLECTSTMYILSYSKYYFSILVY